AFFPARRGETERRGPLTCEIRPFGGPAISAEARRPVSFASLPCGRFALVEGGSNSFKRIVPFWRGNLDCATCLKLSIGRSILSRSNSGDGETGWETRFRKSMAPGNCGKENRLRGGGAQQRAVAEEATVLAGIRGHIVENPGAALVGTVVG